jgi:hypothetical protein
MITPKKRNDKDFACFVLDYENALPMIEKGLPT